MSFTYNPNLSSDTHKVRFRIMDTDAAAAKVQDEEIGALLAQVGGTGWATALRAAARIARSLHVRHGLVSSLSAIGTAITYKDRTYLDLANELEQEAEALSPGTQAMPYVGGISRADKAAVAADPDRVEPFARVGVHDTDNFTTAGGG